MAKWNSYDEHRSAYTDSSSIRKDREHYPVIFYWKRIFIGILVLGLVGLGIAIYALFQGFSNVILDTHRGNLMNITESAANNLEIYLRSFQVENQSMLELDQFLTAEAACKEGDYDLMNQFLEESVRTRGDEIEYITYYLAPMGFCACAGEDRDYTMTKMMGADDIFERIQIMRDERGEYYFCIGAQSDEGGWLMVYVSMRTVFDKTSGYIQMGKNGYVMYKDSTGLILMHPVDEQIGIDVLADRKKMHPDFDFSELEVLIEHQMEAMTGVETYYSYWWGAENPTKVKKVSAYLPLYLGTDFIIVSSVIDYSEVAGQIQSHASQIIIVISLLLLVFMILMFGLAQSMRKQSQTARENWKLMEINENLEKLRREEEQLAHQQRLQLVGTMTSGIAHEFNNLLTPIMGYSTLILSDMSPEDENYEDMKAILDSAEKAKEIIARINQFSGKNAEKMMSPIHVSETLDKAIVLTDAAKRRHIQLTTQVDRTRDVVMGNPTQIQQMVMNLCNNALQAMGSQPGTLTIVGAPVKGALLHNPFFKGKEKNWFYQITVSDTGCGMSQETMSQIFVPFFTTKRPGEGTGLGMSVVSRMVEAHNGLICVESDEGVGTTFRIYLPLMEEPEKDLVEPAQV